MSENLSLSELQHIMQTMNGNGSFEGRCEICASARQKLAAMIVQVQERPTKEVRDIGGHTVLVEHTKG